MIVPPSPGPNRRLAAGELSRRLIWSVEMWCAARGWEMMVEGVSERAARNMFTNIEMACSTNVYHWHTEIKLWRGGNLELHVHWHRVGGWL